MHPYIYIYIYVRILYVCRVCLRCPLHLKLELIGIVVFIFKKFHILSCTYMKIINTAFSLFSISSMTCMHCDMFLCTLIIVMDSHCSSWIFMYVNGSLMNFIDFIAFMECHKCSIDLHNLKWFSKVFNMVYYKFN